MASEARKKWRRTTRRRNMAAKRASTSEGSAGSRRPPDATYPRDLGAGSGSELDVDDFDVRRLKDTGDTGTAGTLSGQAAAGASRTMTRAKHDEERKVACSTDPIRARGPQRVQAMVRTRPSKVRQSIRRGRGAAIRGHDNGARRRQGAVSGEGVRPLRQLQQRDARDRAGGGRMDRDRILTEAVADPNRAQRNRCKRPRRTAAESIGDAHPRQDVMAKGRSRLLDVAEPVKKAEARSRAEAGRPWVRRSLLRVPTAPSAAAEGVSAPIDGVRPRARIWTYNPRQPPAR